MDIIVIIAASIVAAGLTGYVGFRVGVALRTRPDWWYWVANGIAIVLGTAVIAVGYIALAEALKAAGLAIIVGGLTGMKYGLAQVVGQWRAGDPYDGPSGS
jgi:hypothetical protein